MFDEIPARTLRNDIGGVLRRVEAGETLSVTMRASAIIAIAEGPSLRWPDTAAVSA